MKTLEIPRTVSEANETKNQVVVLTGAGGRFGHFLAERLLAESRITTILLTSDPSKLRIEQDPLPIIHRVELSNPQSVSEIFGRIHDEQGDIDVLINNAAMTTVPGFNDFVSNADDTRVKESFAVNCAGALYCIKYTLNRGRDHDKKIINILAGRALTGHVRHVEYYSSKAGLYNATKTLANDYPRHYFRNIMSGRIDLGEGGDNPESMWAFFRDFILDPNPPQYREIYFRNWLENFWHLLRYYVHHFRSCERRDVIRNFTQLDRKKKLVSKFKRVLSPFF